ncbi:tRNA (adenosine(37)-N6)-threonylcarbamoyltransferase complex ATPase subunit type 1 TsaE [Candidatus Uhrbacteria bacterium]|nr:tRNA (adenosine(37)-N6)-threonylcarbamoyltransferase complex ATPase subunit type 1 TsaE [Candidatus Uhrbacteria bacterium]
METKINNIKELEHFAKKFSQHLKPGDVIGLVGELGAGKTTFVQYFAKALGVKARVNSPTFLVMKVYPIKKQETINKKQPRKPIPYTLYPKLSSLVHIDAYRLKSGEDLEAIGAMDYIGAPEIITVIEWADRVKKILSKKTRWIHFEHGTAEDERVILLQ